MVIINGRKKGRKEEGRNRLREKGRKDGRERGRVGGMMETRNDQRNEEDKKEKEKETAISQFNVTGRKLLYTNSYLQFTIYILVLCQLSNSFFPFIDTFTSFDIRLCYVIHYKREPKTKEL